MSQNKAVEQWVDEMARLVRPEKIVWCDGSAEERERLTAEAVRAGELIPLSSEKLPGCYLHRSHPSDVARTENLTFICTPAKETAGPTNNWMAPGEAYAKLRGIFEGGMKGRAMYVVPFLMGPVGSPFSRVGVELTDSRYVVLNMGMMTRMGEPALRHLGSSGDFTRGLHSIGDLSPERRFICHFPQDNTIWSVGSGYGGNALLGKKCMALRIAGFLGRNEGWLAEHMLIVGVEDPAGEVHYIAAAFPSACGKTNLAMLLPPERFQGYKIWTVGDDIAWIRIGPDGRFWAINPEAGFFGVAPGTSWESNPNAMRMLQKDVLFTNVALNPDSTVWWEGMTAEPPAQALDWKGKPWTPQSADKAAQPNSRFTVSIRQSPTFSPQWDNPQGVPLSAIVFGARRAKLIPLVYESFSWSHGTFLGATMASETTAAATGAVGVVRRDPMAMLPFCGYHMGDYFGHWLEMGRRASRPPKIFRVNWFHKDENGRFLWPGFGENLRVLKWMIERSKGKGHAEETPIGFVPGGRGLDLEGLNLSEAALEGLFSVDREGWRQALRSQKEFFEKFGARLPQPIWDEHHALARRLHPAVHGAARPTAGQAGAARTAVP